VQWDRKVDIVERSQPAQPEPYDGGGLAASERSAGGRRQRDGRHVRLRTAGGRLRPDVDRPRTSLVQRDAAHGPRSDGRRTQHEDRPSPTRGLWR